MISVVAIFTGVDLFSISEIHIEAAPSKKKSSLSVQRDAIFQFDFQLP